MSMKKLVLFDVCWTLINWDSTNLYIDYLSNNWYNNIIYKLLKSKIIFLISIYLFKLTKLNFYRKLTFLYFKWIKKDVIKNINDSFLEEYIDKLKYTKNILIEQIKNWYDIFLLSASINPPIELIANHFWIKYFATNLIINNWIYTWFAEYDLLNQKEYVIKNWFIDLSNYDEVSFYTDNFEDVSLMSYLQKNYKDLKLNVNIVINNNIAKSKWQNILTKNKINNYEYIH